tara:strand:+ start:617 stop:838 length:222 start_codon:yes stop_codon:yes gene_type:complete
MKIFKNGFQFQVVQQTQHYNGTTWTNKKVVEITPTGQTRYDLQEHGELENYPEYHTRDVDETLEEIVYDLTTA